MVDGETMAKGAAGAKDENSRGPEIMPVSQNPRHLRVQGPVQAPATSTAATAASSATATENNDRMD